ncbi:hypothetical protein [Haliangium sp.]|uniref:hypothetical protein n=1 Tax=Haliangium sp. TaxID=2663208 RepID=UPI003D11A171
MRATVPPLTLTLALALCLPLALATACGGAPAPAAAPPTAHAQGAPGAEVAPDEPSAQPAVQGSGQSADPGAEAAPGPMAPTPFTAEQIRAATHPGRTYRYEVEDGGQRITVTMTFVEVTAEAATVERQTITPDGKVIASATSHSTWDELVAHAAYPEAATEITETPLSTPAGDFDCLLYTVTGVGPNADQDLHVYFARELPGAPVKMEVSTDGEVVFSMLLIEHLPGQ